MHAETSERARPRAWRRVLNKSSRLMKKTAKSAPSQDAESQTSAQEPGNIDISLKVPACKDEWPTPWQAILPLRFPRGSRGNQPGAKIPKIVHFVFGYKSTEVPVFTFLNYVAVASALAVIQPESVMLHVGQEPSGFFWELVRPHVLIVRGRRVDSIFGNPVDYYAHKADIIRLEALIKYGGIYLDIDVVTLRPVDDLLHHETVMGEEGEGGRVGLCNGVILSAPRAPFVVEWYNRYKTFNQAQWNYHSVILPMEMAKKKPKLVYRLPYNRFHWPLWDEPGLKLMMGSYEYDYSENFAVHMWSHGLARSAYRNFSMDWCYECHSTLVSKLRVMVPDPMFSVIMPCYNQAKYIREAMLSVVNQSFPSWEIIVIDDVSSDSCGKVAEDFGARLHLFDENRLRVINNTENSGLSESRNIGIRVARGLWICALDPDDKIHPDYFRNAVRAMAADPSIHMITSDQRFFEGSAWLWELPQFDTVTVMTRGPLPVMTLYLRRLWERVGGYSSALPWGNEDFDFWTKLLIVGAKLHKLPGELVMYRYKKDSMMRDSARYTDEEHAMMKTMHLELFLPSKLFQEHRKIMAMSNASRTRLSALASSGRLSNDDLGAVNFWVGLSDMEHGSYSGAVSKMSRAMGVPKLGWQPALYRALCLCNIHGPNASAREMEMLKKHHPSLRKTAVFARHERNCLAASQWSPSIAHRRDERSR